MSSVSNNDAINLKRKQGWCNFFYQFPMEGKERERNTSRNLQTPIRELPQELRMPARMRASAKTLGRSRRLLTSLAKVLKTFLQGKRLGILHISMCVLHLSLT